MACGYDDAKKSQLAVRWRAYIKSGQIIDGCNSTDWRALKTYVYHEHSLLLAGRIYFNNDTSRNFGGWSWSYMIEDGDCWTIDDDRDANVILLKYPDAILIPGGTVMEAEMQIINKAMSEGV